eukprot:TRINITY_DN39647_c2_g1_i1.p1 TRINITY_DN39647_c2_g1~~TRINITY_DN39647_c2_g1_i1.p1  ORF type:complete len:105 (-),score=11.81 TRINITY_DN39647_c2_g1_i1:77-391(-)
MVQDVSVSAAAGNDLCVADAAPMQCSILRRVQSVAPPASEVCRMISDWIGAAKADIMHTGCTGSTAEIEGNLNLNARFQIGEMYVKRLTWTLQVLVVSYLFGSL